jgi:hypothetical protein
MSSLSEAFNYWYRATKETDVVLRVQYGPLSTFYDFAGRTVVTTNWEKGGVAVTPFSQVDRETLITMRDKLIELKGNPPELPAETSGPILPGKKFNL